MSKSRRRADGKPEYRSIDQLLAEAAQDDVVQRLPGKGRPIDLSGYMHADAQSRVANKLLADNNVIPQQLQDRREAEMLLQQAEADAATARQDLLPRRCQVEQLQRQLRACWPPSVAPDEVFSPVDVPVWLTHTVAKPDDDGDWQELTAQLATSSAAHNRPRDRPPEGGRVADEGRTPDAAIERTGVLVGLDLPWHPADTGARGGSSRAL